MANYLCKKLSLTPYPLDTEHQ